MTALVTGVGGQDGVLVARRLLREGRRVVGTVRPGWRSPMSVYLDGVEVVEVDLRDTDAMHRLVADVAPDEVYHLAGVTSVAASHRDPDLVRAVNDVATGSLLAGCLHHVPGARLFLASSSEVFGPVVTGPRDESTPFDPRSPYAVSKVRVHEHADAARARGQFVAVGILSNHESPIRGAGFVTRKVTRSAAAIAQGSDAPLVLGNLDVSRDWGAATDVVDAMVRLLRVDEPRDVVVATGRLHTMADLVESAFAAAGIDDPWPHVQQDPALVRAADTPGSPADIDAASRWLGWRPTVTFEDLVASMVEVDGRRLDTGVEEHPDYLD